MPFVSHAYLESLTPEKREQLLRTHMNLGYQPETYDELLLPDDDRYAGTYVCGVQGNGKSFLLENMIAYDARVGNSVIVIDPHGDLVTNCLAQLPPHRLAQTYLLDMEDKAFPVGINLFSVGKLDTSLAYTQAVDRIMHIFEVLWPDVLSQQNLPRYVRAATITLLANPGTTLVDMQTMLTNEPYRAKLLQNVTDPTVRQFWHDQYDSLSPAEQNRRVQPLIGRLESLFMGRSLVRNIVGQRVTTVNFRAAIENHEIIFVRLPVKTAKQDARLIGTLLLAQIHAAVFSFANIEKSKRPGVSLYVDETQNFATPDFAELLSEGRKFGMKLTLAHQYRAQLPSFLHEPTMAARTKICFQLTPEDGREMAHTFPAQEEAVQVEDIEARPVEYLLTYGSDEPTIRTFIDYYLRPMQTYKHGGKVDIEGSHLVYDVWHGIKQHDDLYVSDPTPYLNNLLYEVMRTGNEELPIPVDAVMGFANCGRKFFNAVRGLSNGNQFLTASVKFPYALVVQGANGLPNWTRPPESSLEQFYHFLFHLRMTMHHLADEPIGKKTTPSHGTVGQMLTNLPKRAAFVRSTETIGVIYTHDTPERLKGRELLTRIQAVFTQTRKKYCHPREEVEQAFMNPTEDNTTPPPPPTRWEEI